MIETLQRVGPAVGSNVCVAPTATVVGNVRLGDEVSIWHGAVVRGDVWSISIGDADIVHSLYQRAGDCNRLARSYIGRGEFPPPK